MRRLIATMLLLVSPLASATKVEPMPLPELVRESTEIAVATADSFYGRKADGKVVVKGQFRTRPGQGNVLVFRMRIVRVLRGNVLKVGQVHDLDHWTGWHMLTNLSAKPDHFPILLMYKASEARKLIPAYPPDSWINGNLEKEVQGILNSLN